MEKNNEQSNLFLVFALLIFSWVLVRNFFHQPAVQNDPLQVTRILAKEEVVLKNDYCSLSIGLPSSDIRAAAVKLVQGDLLPVLGVNSLLEASFVDNFGEKDLLWEIVARNDYSVVLQTTIKDLIITREIALDHNILTLRDKINNPSAKKFSLSTNSQLLLFDNGYNDKNYSLVVASGGQFKSMLLSSITLDTKEKNSELDASWLGVVNNIGALIFHPCYENGTIIEGAVGGKSATWIGKPLVLNPNSQTVKETLIFVGRKELANLEQNERYIKNLPYILDFGWLFFITRPIYQFMVQLNNHGLEAWVILLVFSFLLTFIPEIFIFIYKKIFGGKKIDFAAEMAAIEKKYVDNPEMLEMEKARLNFKKVSFMGLVLNIFQMLFFISFRNLTQMHFIFYKAPFLWFTNDLAAPDPTNILGFINLGYRLGLFELLAFSAMISSLYDKIKENRFFFLLIFGFLFYPFIHGSSMAFIVFTFINSCGIFLIQKFNNLQNE